MIKLILRDLVRAIAAVLGYYHVLLVLLLEELLVDLGNVLRNDLGVRMRVHDGWSDLLEIILRSRQIAKVVLLPLSCIDVVSILLTLVVLSGLQHLVLDVTARA